MNEEKTNFPFAEAEEEENTLCCVLSKVRFGFSGFFNSFFA
jgi:hypothetical protein